MGIASLVLGIVSTVLGFIPFCGMIALIPAIVGLVLGIVDLVKKNKAQLPKGMAIAGTILSAVAICIILVWVLIISAGVGTTMDMVDDSLYYLNSFYY